jgi:NAD(P)H-flavin reductase
MKLFHTYKSKMISATTTSATDGASKAMIIQLQRPTLFTFKPGQYAYIRHCDIDSHWHPFSIASDPDSAHLEFFIGVEGKETSWTSKLNSFVEDGRVNDTQFEIMGPYGSPLGKAGK